MRLYSTPHVTHKLGVPRKFFKTNRGPVYAAGVLFYVYDDENRCKVLVQIKQHKTEDIGGKVDIRDRDIYETVIREVKEETNREIKISKHRLIESKFLYIPKAKYVLFLINATQQEKNLKSEDFKNYEYSDYHRNFRTLTWEYLVNLNELPLNSRISQEVINQINTLLN